MIVLDEEAVATQNFITQEGVVAIGDGETTSKQWHANLEIYLGQQRNLVGIKTLYKHILPLKLQHYFPWNKKNTMYLFMIFWWIIIYFKVLNSHTCWSMFLPSIVFMFISSTIMVTLIIFCVFVFCNRIKTSWQFSFWIHRAQYLNQSKYGLDHTFLDVVNLNIFGLEVISLLIFSRLEVINLLFLKLLLSLCTSLLNFQAGSMDLVDGWYQHLIHLLGCVHHVVESYKWFSLYSCFAKSFSTNNRRRFDDSYWCIRILIMWGVFPNNFVHVILKCSY